MKKFDFDEISSTEQVRKNKHNHVTTTYYLLLKAKISSGAESVADIWSDKNNTIELEN